MQKGDDLREGMPRQHQQHHQHEEWKRRFGYVTNLVFGHALQQEQVEPPPAE